MTIPAINLQNIHYRYRNSPANHTGLTVTQWQVETASRVSLHGNSGSGKTTLLNLLCGILTPISGSISLLGKNISTLSSAERDAFRAKNIGVVFQQFNLIPYLSVFKNIQLATYFAKAKSIDLKGDVQTLLKSLQLPSNIIDRPVNQLSVGQQQCVAIARALINNPRILLVDEPTSALDASARDALMSLLMQICNKTKTTLIFVSHDTSLSHYFDSTLAISSLTNIEENKI